MTVLSNLSSSTSVPAHEIHVATDGNDTDTGDASAPLATLAAARDALRMSGRLGKELCEVVIHAGVHRLDTPLVLSPADSGSKEAPVAYRAAGDGEVVISGAQELDAPWVEWKDGIYRTRVGKSDAIDQLFIDGKRQHMARFPNHGDGFVLTGKRLKGAEAGHAPYDGCAPDAWDTERVDGWKDPAGAFMHGMHQGLWGGMHYRVLGKNKDGSLKYEGGWQNNRAGEPHDSYRMIENVFEELDAPGEWFHDVPDGWLYYMPPPGLDLSTCRVETVSQLKHLIDFYGDIKHPMETLMIPKSGNGVKDQRLATPQTVRPVRHIRLQGLTFRGTARTFMETKEPILRSDWCLYRGGAIHIRGSEDVSIECCNFETLGGNAVFVDGYNRRVKIRGNLFENNGATDIHFVGSPAAVRDPAFSFSADQVPLDKVDTAIGPKTEEYPADCLAEDNLITRCGRFEKQSSGINISMSSRIHVRHNTISHTPRAAINICDGTWGGHLIEWNDCFETVLETHDHGAFNSWGRDRYWHKASPSGPQQKDDNGKPLISYWIETYPNSPRWDAYQPIILRHNRMHCDHGWDIDLDDGSSNYEIYNNICLSGGLKTREGYYRTVRNNVIINNYTCNVPYPKPTYDIFESNIIWGRGYHSSCPTLWGGVRNKTFFHNPDSRLVEAAIATQSQTLDDADSLYGNAQFRAPQQGDFSVSANSPALRIGFSNFPMSGFGVTSDRLKSMAGEPRIDLPNTVASNSPKSTKSVRFLGASIKTLSTAAELTATGMFQFTGVYLMKVPDQSEMARYTFKTDDVILSIDDKEIAESNDLIAMFKNLQPGEHTAKVWRDQQACTLQIAK